MDKVGSKKLVDRIKLEIPSDLKYEKVVREVTETIATRMGFSASDVKNMKVVVDEASSNAIRHAKPKDSKDNKVVITFTVEPAKLVISIRDKGKGFKPKEVKPSIEGLIEMEGGRGIFLMENLVDEVHYNTGLRRGTTVRLTKYLNTENKEEG